MTDNKAIQVIQPPAIQTWQVIQSVAAEARAIGGLQSGQAAMMMLQSCELGFGLSAAFQFFDYIDGKISLKPKGALALIHRSGIIEMKLTRLTDKGNFHGYSCKMKRTDTGFEFERTFTLDDAKRAQLTEGSPSSKGARGYGNWEKYPENMCMWRSIGFCADVVCPDLLGGLSLPVDFAPADEHGTSVDVPYIVGKPSPATPLPFDPAKELQTLVALGYTPDRIMTANGGKIPTTKDELDAVLSKLSDEDNKAALEKQKAK